MKKEIEPSVVNHLKTINMKKEIEPTVVNYLKNNQYEKRNSFHCSKLSKKQ